MAWYYVKDDGTAGSGSDAGREGLSARTGTWTATTGDYYESITHALAASTAPTAGDYICISDASSDALTATVTDVIPSGVALVTVDDDAVDTINIATTQQITMTNANTRNHIQTDAGENSVVVYGLNTEQKHHWTPVLANCKSMRFEERVDMAQDNRGIELTALRAQSLWANFELTGGAYWTINDHQAQILGGTFSSTQSSSPSIILGANKSLVSFCGVDMSTQSASTLVQFSTTTTSINAVHLCGCALPAAWSLSNLSSSAGSIALIESCDSAYQWNQQTYAGEIDFVENIYYDAHDTLDDGSTKGSFEFDTNSDTSFNDFLTFGYLPNANYKSLSAINTEAASKTKVRLRFAPASGSALTDADIIVFVGYPVSGAAYQQQWVTHIKSPLKTGAALSTETTSGNWTGTGLATNAYYLDIDMGAPVNGRVNVIPAVVKPNVTVYFSWQLEFVA